MMSISIDTNSGTIGFVQFHQPSIPSGTYSVQVIQTLNIQGQSSQPDPFTITRTFTIAGERFAIKPDDVQAVFPPSGSLGEYANVLPHIIFTRSTFPWERQAEAGTTPWLALLLFEDGEKPAPQIITLGNLTTSSARYPSFQLENGQTNDDLVTVIDVPTHLLLSIMPNANATDLLAHVRIAENADTSQSEQAVLIGSRLPVRGGTSTVHLVSLENRYLSGSFNYQGASNNDLIRLVSLYSWSFSCVAEEESFQGLLHNLDHGALRLPVNSNPEVEKLLAAGSVLLPHTFRQSGKSVSWYHGPLAPAANTLTVSLPIRSSDELVRYNPTTGIFDISYASAWELGRLLALQSKQFSTNLYLWKRTAVQQMRGTAQQSLAISLPLQLSATNQNELFQSISLWFASLSLLTGVPFNYLVPDERLLPRESVLFFWLDHLWIDCLLDGAFSIGRVTSSDYDYDQGLGNTNNPARQPNAQVTGFLLRSDLVSGWPNLVLNGYDSSGNPLPILRTDYRAPDVLLCLYTGELSRLIISQKPETLHFGLDQDNQTPPGFFKILRDQQGDEQPKTLTLSSVPWIQESDRVLDIATLAKEIGSTTSVTPFTSAQFAFQMIESATQVSFQRSA
jgi:hypothetical protein